MKCWEKDLKISLHKKHIYHECGISWCIFLCYNTLASFREADSQTSVTLSAMFQTACKGHIVCNIWWIQCKAGTPVMAWHVMKRVECQNNYVGGSIHHLHNALIYCTVSIDIHIYAFLKDNRETNEYKAWETQILVFSQNGMLCANHSCT